MRVLVILSKHRYPLANPQPEIFPQGPAYVVAALKAAGHEVAGVNTSYMLSHRSATEQLFLAMAQVIREFQPQAICVGGLSADYLFLSHAILMCRNLASQTPVILGGGIVSADRHFIMSDLHPDFAIAGDAEIPVVELLKVLEKGGDLKKVQGLAFWQDGQPVFNPLRADGKIMPTYPLPSYDELGIEEFFQTSSHSNASHITTLHPRPRLFPVSAGRSCPYKCTFCYHSSGGGAYQQRAIIDVLREIEFFHEKYNFNCLVIYDELFSVKEKRVREFCEGIRDLKRDFLWTCSMRVPDMTEDLLRDMKDAGCAMVAVGFESASDRVLKSMRKQITVQQIRQAIEAANQAGIIIQAQFIFGDPAETEETFRETMAFAAAYAGKVSLSLGRIIPFPSSALYNNALQDGTIPSPRHFYHASMAYNLTKIPTERFDALLSEAFVTYGSSLVQGQVDPHMFLVVQPLEPGHDFKRTFVVIEVTCPHCQQKLDYLYDYPGDIAEYDQGNHKPLMDMCKSLRHTTCMHCSKAFLFKMFQTSQTLCRITMGTREVPRFRDLLTVLS